MSNRKYYKVTLSTIDFEKTMESVPEMRSPEMLDIINKSSTTDLRDVIVYKTIFGNFRELITDKPIAAITEELKPYSNSEHDYSMTTKRPLFFKCNTSMSADLNREYPTLDSMVVGSEDVEKYLIEHLGEDKSEQKMNVYEYLSDLYTEECRASDKYEALLDYYGLTKKDKKETVSEGKKIKSLIRKYDI